ncbi:hypothetical protein Z043_125880, partial [Scleropages formosus]
MDVVTSTALSVDIDSLNNPKDPFVTNIKKMFKLDFFNPLFLIVAFFPFIVPLLEKLNFSFFPSSVTDFFYASLRKIKAERKTKVHKATFFPFMAPLLEKLNFSLFPSSVTDFFYASLRKIKAERKTKVHK